MAALVLPSMVAFPTIRISIKMMFFVLQFHAKESERPDEPELRQLRGSAQLHRPDPADRQGLPPKTLHGTVASGLVNNAIL